MEMLVELSGPLDNGYADQAFITGIMSMMPAAGAADGRDPGADHARRRNPERPGQPHGASMLELVDAPDAERSGDACDTLLAELRRPAITRAALNTCLIESLRWINRYAYRRRPADMHVEYPGGITAGTKRSHHGLPQRAGRAAATIDSARRNAVHHDHRPR